VRRFQIVPRTWHPYVFASPTEAATLNFRGQYRLFSPLAFYYCLRWFLIEGGHKMGHSVLVAGG